MVSHNDIIKGPAEVQLVFQGGGAKLCDLLAAAEAVQMLIGTGKIKVTRVAGASAGAIVACLLASGESIERVRERLASEGAKHLKSIAPKRNRASLAWRFINGQPIYEPDALRTFFGWLFNFSGRSYTTIGDLKHSEVIITASDIVNGSKVVYRSPTDRIVDILVDSCGLPFVFKAPNNGGRIVDGGICENLPTRELLDDVKTHGTVLGFSFERSSVPSVPKSLKSYGLALLDTAMQNSINRAIADIGPSFVFPIKTDITTFEFDRALSEGLSDDHYLRVRGQCHGWLSDVAQLIDVSPIIVVDEIDESSEMLTYMESVHKVYLSQHHDTPIRYERSQLEVTAWPLLNPNDHRYHNTYHIRHRVTFRPDGEKVYCVRLGLFSDGTNVVKGLVSGVVRDAKGNTVETTIVPTSVPAELKSDPLGLQRYLLFFFDKPIDPSDLESAPYTLELQDYVEGALDGLKENKEEAVYIASDRTFIAEVEVVVYVPEPYNRLIPHSYESPSENCLPGDLIPKQELVQAGYTTQPGFVSVGWKGKGLKLGQTFGVLLTPRK